MENINIDLKNKKVTIGNIVVDVETQQVTIESPTSEKAVAKQVKSTISKTHAKRTKKGMDNLKKTGKKFTSSIYGWNNDKGELKPNWKEQHNIRVMRNLLKKGFSRGSIAKQLNALGIKGKRGGKWQSGAIKRVVENDFHRTALRRYPPSISTLRDGPNVFVTAPPKWFKATTKSLKFKV